MKYEAIESFSGVISMAVGEVREIPNEALAKDLMKSGLIKKYTPNDAKSLKKELDEANKRIAILEQEKTELEEEISKLKEVETTSEDEEANADEETEENEPSEEDGNPEDENGEDSEEVETTSEDETPKSEE